MEVTDSLKEECLKERNLSHFWELKFRFFKKLHVYSFLQTSTLKSVKTNYLSGDFSFSFSDSESRFGGGDAGDMTACFLCFFFLKMLDIVYKCIEIYISETFESDENCNKAKY